MRHGVITLLFILVGTIGCQTLVNKTPSRQGTVKRKTNKIAKRYPPLSSPEAPGSILHEKMGINQTFSQEATELSGPVELTEKEKVFFELAGEKVDSLSEISIYKKAVEASKNGDEAALEAFSSLLLKKFPRSIYCDNIIYIQGMLAFGQKKYGASLSYFQKILNHYPQSNKAVSALFAKGVVFRKMNLEKEAARTLAQVINKYPGSPESIRAQDELKLVTQ
jgi:TolA-binding protein